MPPLNKHLVQIAILDDSSGEKCGIQCGIDLSLAEAIALTRQQICPVLDTTNNRKVQIKHEPGI